MRHLRNKNELMMLQSHLEEMSMQIEQEKNLVISQKINIQNDVRKLRKILKENKKILKKNETFLFSIKESLVATVKDYEELVDILHKVAIQEIDHNRVMALLVGAENKIFILQDHFAKVFGMTTYQYIDKAKQTEKQN